MKPSNMLSNMELKLIIYDFDGIMTNNTAFVLEDGKEGVIINRSDGIGVNMIKELGIPQIILSTEENSVVAVRAKKLGLPVFQGIRNKKQALFEISRKQNVALKNIMYVGNDVNDLDCMKAVGLAVAPADAYDEVRSVAKIVLKSGGGEGVVREIAGYLTATKQ